ncbi:hypothetical protein COY93_02305 [Candidatus Uhrbacteria bacterium CG_4_10_14_0_8_um_filter_58_22]|uniref:Uncharacterized protein n=1 Tax=Candidatus Uhrbacteria bacterium CG_4_10_14_0_8_um_filter_58_22 TaxID=1975029 RepID=A0A2M7QA42_9BACT|nr:MAG: hypothetical protein COY93_02305 [Candidatus Uhrbacteria bacterium CG_4_10_14_0_8_um_filter_58_22]
MRCARFSRPKTKSVLRPRSWASSTITTSKSMSSGSCCSRPSRIPSVMKLARVPNDVSSSKRT